VSRAPAAKVAAKRDLSRDRPTTRSDLGCFIKTGFSRVDGAIEIWGKTRYQAGCPVAFWKCLEYL